MRKFAGIRPAALIAAATFALPGAASAASIACGTGDLLAVDVATVPTTQVTSSKTLGELPGTSIDVPSQACMRVQFTAQVKASAGGLRIRVVVDGVPAAPNFVDFHTAGDDFDNRSATFVITGLSVATHTVAMQYASTNGQSVTVSKAVMTVWSNTN